MQSIFKELYYGNIQPTGKFYGPDSDFVKNAKLRQSILDKLMETLNEQEKELFEQYCDANSNIEEIARYGNFSYALKFGIMLMIEVFMGADEIIDT